MSTASVFVYSSAEVGAPTLTNTAGSLIALLKGLGVTGFNAGAATITVSSGVATVSRAAHGFAPIDTGMTVAVQVEGAAPAALNGKQACTIVDANSFTFLAPGVPDGAASGSIVVRRAPFGLQVAAEAGNVCIFTRTDPAANPFGLHIDHSAASVITARSLESWTSTSAYTGSMPVGGADWSGLLWHTSEPNPPNWCVVADSRMLYLFGGRPGYTYSSSGSLYESSVLWGDFPTLNSLDAYATAIAVNTQALGTYSRNSANPGGCSFQVQRGISQIGSPVSGVLYTLSHYSSAAYPLGHNSGGMPAYPSPIDGGFTAAYPVAIDSGGIRGSMPGVAEPLAMIGGAIQRKRIPGIAGIGRDFFGVGYGHAGSNPGCALFDITGPWR